MNAVNMLHTKIKLAAALYHSARSTGMVTSYSLLYTYMTKTARLDADEAPLQHIALKWAAFRNKDSRGMRVTIIGNKWSREQGRDGQVKLRGLWDG